MIDAVRPNGVVTDSAWPNWSSPAWGIMARPHSERSRDRPYDVAPTEQETHGPSQSLTATVVKPDQ